MTTGDELSNTEKKLYEYIASFGANTDVDIRALYVHLYKLDPDNTTRTAQQVVGAFISRINKKLEGAEIKPGRLKQTYRLVPNKGNTKKA